MNVDKRLAVITGGGQGLGRHMALAVAQKGGDLALIDMNATRLRETQEACEAFGAQVSIWECDVSHEQSVDRTFQEIVAHHGRLDILVNNAGITRDGLLLRVSDGEVTHRMSLEDWQQVMDVNLTGVFLCGRAAASEMVRLKDGGCIVNISSISRHGNRGQSNYSAAKAGVAALTVTWAKELARHQIRCVGIAPGYMGTEMVMSMKPDALERVAQTIPQGRLGQPEEIAHTLLFALENDYITGRVLDVDGGLRI